jgi:subtilisin family serine protease
MPAIISYLRSIAVASVAAIFAVSVAGAPAWATAEEVLRQLQESGFADVIVRMKADSPSAVWNATHPAWRQKIAVAAALNDVQPSLAAAQVESYRTFRTLPFLSATINQNQLLALIADDSVQSVHLVKRERRNPGTAASVPGSFIDRAQGANALLSIDVADAWAAGHDGTGYAVAIIDGGFNVGHPMLAGRTMGAACFSNDFDTTTINQCPSGQTPEIGVGAASNCPAGSDRCGHGTHVASIAVGNDGVNFGVARAATLVPIDVFSTVTDADDCSPSPAPCELTDSLAVLNALDYVNENAEELNIAAVNISVGGSTRDGFCDDDPRKPVIDMLRQKGVAVAISAGNNGVTGQITSPACISSALAVGATNDGAAVASFSNFASTLDFMAPGVSVRGAAGSGNGFGLRSGTSMAAPQVAGAWAVMRSAFPDGEFDAIETALKTSGVGVTRLDSGTTVPKIRVARAIDLLNGRDRRSINNVVSSNATALGESFLRFFNNSDEPGTLTVTLRDGQSGTAVAMWTSPEIPARASRQFSARKLETASTPATNSALSVNDRVYFNLEIESSFSGFLQHVIWSRGSGVFANLSSCASGFSQDVSFVSNVHTSTIGGYISHLRIVNSGATTDQATLVIYNSTTGEEVSSWTSPDISSGASFEITGPALEAQTPNLETAVSAGMLQYNVRLENLTGYVQHVMENVAVGALIDMSPKCDLGVAVNTAPNEVSSSSLK